MPKKNLTKKQSAELSTENVDQKKKQLKKILPKGDKGTVIASLQMGDFCISFPIPLPKKLSDGIKKAKTKSRTIVESGDAKIGVDVI